MVLKFLQNNVPGIMAPSLKNELFTPKPQHLSHHKSG